MKDILLPNEDILYSNKIQRIKKNVAEERIIVLTDRYVYNLRNKKYRNKVDIRNITGITISKSSDEFVIHTCEIDDDFHYTSNKRSYIVELLARIFYCQTRKKIDLSLVEKSFWMIMSHKKVIKRAIKEKQNSIQIFLWILIIICMVTWIKKIQRLWLLLRGI